MDKKETHKRQFRYALLINNDEYFTYVYKKTEKIVGAVFYVIGQVYTDSVKDALVTSIEATSLKVLEDVKDTLGAFPHEREHHLTKFKITLVSLEGKIGLLRARQVIGGDVYEAFRHEVHSVLRTLRTYIDETAVVSPLEMLDVPLGGVEQPERRRVARREVAVTPHERGAQPIGVSAVTRQEQILAIIKDKGAASIKDVSSVIHDVSEKTIQRELMTLIDKGLVSKTGERRWSKYSIISQN